MKLNICIVTNQLGDVKSGVGTHSRILAAHLPRAGHHVTVICPEEQKQKHHSANAHSANAHSAGQNLHIVTVQRPRSLGHATWLLLAPRLCGQLERLLSNERFDVIHFTDAKSAYYLDRRKAHHAVLVGNVNDFYLADARRNPLFYRRHFPDWKRRYAYYHLARPLEKRALKKLDCAICNTQYVSRVLHASYGLPRSRLFVMYKAVDYAHVQKMKKPLPKSRKATATNAILFVGGNYCRKGLPLIIRALPLVRQALSGVRLHVIGADPAEARLRALARRLQVDGCITWHGWLNNDAVLRQLSRAAVFAMPSLYEAFGVVYLEAMALKVPVIGSTVGGTGELIQDGRNGFLVDPHDADALARRLIHVLTDAALRERVVAEGIRTAKQHTDTRIIRETLALYSRLMAGRAPPARAPRAQSR